MKGHLALLVSCAGLLAVGVPNAAADDRATFGLGPNVHVGLRLKLQIDSADGDVGISRKRVGIEGRAFGRFEYQVERELDGKDPWRDVFVDTRLLDTVQVRSGKFKLPFSLDQLTSPTRLNFVYRSRIGQDLAPGRDLGVAVHGRLFERRVGYELGLFSRDGDNARRNENPGAGATAAGRLTIRPSRTSSRDAWLRYLEVGLNATVGDIAEGRHSLSLRDSLGEPVADPVYVKGRRARLGVDARWRHRGFSVAAEGLQARDQRQGQGILGEDLSPVMSGGWYVGGTWLVTGETKTDWVEPLRPIFRGGVGAVELAARVENSRRWSHGDEAPSMHPRAGQLVESGVGIWTLGVNWYLNRWVKVQANAVRERAGGSVTSAGGNIRWMPVFRVQFVL